MVDTLIHKHRHPLWIQCLFAGALTILFYSSDSVTFSDPLGIAVLLLLAGSLLLALVPARLRQQQLFHYGLLTVDLTLALLIVFHTGHFVSEFYVFFFLILFVAAVNQNPAVFSLTLVILTAVYGSLIFRAAVDFPTTDSLIRIPLLLVGGLFVGYLVHLYRSEAKGHHSKSAFTARLFEFGKALAEAGDLDELLERIPLLVNAILDTDACELILVEEGKIIRRWLCDSGGPLPSPPPSPVGDSVHRSTFESGDVFATPDRRRNPELRDRVDGRELPYASQLGKVWEIPDGRKAILAVFRKAPHIWNGDEIQSFLLLVEQSILALQNLHLLRRLESEARTDGLTGLGNYRYFEMRLEEEFARSNRLRSPLSVILLDLDHLKDINDTWGHRVGNELLQMIARVLDSSTRRMDVTARIGGDEFAVILPETNVGQSREFCRRLLDLVSRLEPDGLPSVSVSVGSASYPGDGRTPAELLERADRSLYEAKSRGRLQAVHFSELSGSGSGDRRRRLE